MRIGFISPSFRPLEANWDLDYEMVKLGVPTVIGYLYRAGHRDVRHWDFDAQVCDKLQEDPTAFDLRAYFDVPRVKGLIHGTDDSLRAQTEAMLDTLGVVERDVFGISLSAVLDRIVNIRAIIALAESLAVVLKQRYPGCSVIIGGLQASPESLHAEMYKETLEECPFIDYAWQSVGDYRVVQLCRNIVKGQAQRNRDLNGVVGRAPGNDGSPSVYFGSGEDRDPDIQLLDLPLTTPTVHTRTGASARLAELRAGDASALEAATVAAALKESAVIPAKSLMRGRGLVVPEVLPTAEEPHVYDAEEADASKAGPQEYEKIPALVPVFDKELVNSFRYTGAQIMKKFKFNKELLLRYSRFENDAITVLPHIFVKGCNAPCGFCSYAYTKITGEDVEETVAGLKFLSETYECRHFHFLNTQINSVYQYCEAFCEALIRAKLNIFWSDCANMRQLDEKLLEKMRNAGAMRLVFGVESPEDEMLKYIRKGVNVEKVERMLTASHDLGIWNHMLLIAGMPHETKAKQDRMMDFFIRTKDKVDFYSISSFYLIASSPWGREPEKWGIERISSPDQLLEQQAFNEVVDGRWTSDGLKWPEKKEQIVQSTQRFYKTISNAKGQSRSVGGNIDLYLLMWLYQNLGHDNKAEIVRVYEETAKAIGLSSSSLDAKASGVLESHMFRINVPVIVGRVNEGDQSGLVQVPLDVIVSRAEEEKSSFCKTARFSFAYRSPSFEEGRFAHAALSDLKNRWNDIVGSMVKVLGPFLKALDARLAPQTPDRMAELVTANLPRYRPWVDQGYALVDTPKEKGRNVMDRNLQWSGVV